VRSDVLASDLAAERSRAVRLLLRHPLLDAQARPDGFREVVRHHDWLVEWFDDTCGWQLVVDIGAGFARLAKRAQGGRVDTSRPLQRSRGTRQPYDRRRYQLLCLAAAELVQHPITTIGLLARAIAADASLDTSRHRERVALVDVLRTLIEWSALRTTAGELDDFVTSEEANALLHADTTRLHRMLVTTVAPSSLSDETTSGSAIVFLGAEPRYGPRTDGLPVAFEGSDERRLRRVRHMLGRRLVDDPVIYFDELGDDELAYLDNPAGRQWLRARAADAGFELEERTEGLLAVDPEMLATDMQFPGPHGNAHQLALLLVDALLGESSGDRRSVELMSTEIERRVDSVFDRFPNWARSQRDPEGRRALTAYAIDLLEAFGLARRTPAGGLVGRPAIARYRVGEPITTSAAPSLFDQQSPSSDAPDPHP
jgi:uncharacterized protein (TIGR02678 family)